MNYSVCKSPLLKNGAQILLDFKHLKMPFFLVHVVRFQVLCMNIVSYYTRCGAIYTSKAYWIDWMMPLLAHHRKSHCYRALLFALAQCESGFYNIHRSSNRISSCVPSINFICVRGRSFFSLLTLALNHSSSAQALFSPLSIRYQMLSLKWGKLLMF